MLPAHKSPGLAERLPLRLHDARRVLPAACVKVYPQQRDAVHVTTKDLMANPHSTKVPIIFQAMRLWTAAALLPLFSVRALSTAQASLARFLHRHRSVHGGQMHNRGRRTVFDSAMVIVPRLAGAAANAGVAAHRRMIRRFRNK